MAFDLLANAAGFNDFIEYNKTDLEIMQNILNNNNISIDEAVMYFNMPCSKLMVRCRWQYKIVPCSELFQPSMSYHGGCCTFNRYP